MGDTAPREDTAAKLERELDLEQGTLGRLLGYLPGGVQGDAISSIAEAVEADPRLGAKERDLLMAVYRELVRQTQAGEHD